MSVYEVSFDDKANGRDKAGYQKGGPHNSQVREGTGQHQNVKRKMEPFIGLLFGA